MSNIQTKTIHFIRKENSLKIFFLQVPAFKNFACWDNDTLEVIHLSILSRVNLSVAFNFSLELFVSDQVYLLSSFEKLLGLKPNQSLNLFSFCPQTDDFHGCMEKYCKYATTLHSYLDVVQHLTKTSSHCFGIKRHHRQRLEYNTREMLGTH